MKKIALIHTSPAAIKPLKQFFADRKPDYFLINLLDDGILQLFDNNDQNGAVKRIVEMINNSAKYYGAEVALATCTAVTLKALKKIESQSYIPVFKIDVPMVKLALENYNKIGLVATFPPGGRSSLQLFNEMATALNITREIKYIPVDGAYNALLNGDNEKHDELILRRLIGLKDVVDVFVLSQVSMSVLKERVEAETGKPVLTSPEICLNTIEKII